MRPEKNASRGDAPSGHRHFVEILQAEGAVFRYGLARRSGDSLRRFYVKKFAYSRTVLAAMAVVALAIELGAGHKFG
jgi:hypothetical protein